MFSISNKYEAMYNGIVSYGINFIEENPGIETFILGISGGIDSALVACMASEIIKKNNWKVKLIGVSMPGKTNKKDESARAIKICKTFCDRIIIKPITDIADSILASLDTPLAFKSAIEDELSVEEKIRIGNIQARARMICLFDIAKKVKGVVLGTDNFTEYNLGFWTLHGDVGNVGLIQELWKTEVYGLSEWLVMGDRLNRDQREALKECVNAKPTDGLGITSSDLDQILPDFEGDDWRKGYEYVDHILIETIYTPVEGHTYKPNHPVIERYKNSIFKRRDPISINRKNLV